VNEELSITLDPLKEKHTILVSALRARLRRSYDDMSKSYANWATREEQFQAYVKPKEEDKPKRARDPEDTNYSDIYVPYSYAMAMTAHTYLSSVFLGRNPVYQLQGRHGESEQKTLAMEALLDYQMLVGAHLVPLYIWLLDPAKYGMGFLGHYWQNEVITTTRLIEVPRTFMGIPLQGVGTKELQTVDVPGYQGTKLFNIRPQDAFPDTRVPVWRMQEGEFFARYVEIPWSEVKDGARNGTYINLKMIPAGGTIERSSYYQSEMRNLGGAVSNLPGDLDTIYSNFESDQKRKSGMVRGHEFYWKISPREWGLGPSEKYEMWAITLTLNDVIIRAQPMGLVHGQFPIDVLQWEPDGYNVTTRGAMDITKDLEDLMNWLVNSHMYSVRSSQYSTWLYDPTMIVGKDFERPGPGRAIRLKPNAYGRDVRTMLQQMPYQDTTQNNLGNAQYVSDIMQRVLGVTDNVMGQVNQGGRKTATEVRTSTSFSVNRLKTIAEFYSAVGFGPFAQKLVQTTQQNFDQERAYRIVGDLALFSPGFMQVTPDMIAGFYDFVPVDGTFPVDRFAQANLWQMMMGQMVKFPQIMMQYDMGKIFGWVAQLAGIKNINQFRVNVQDPNALAAAAAAGNVVPIGGQGKSGPPDLNRGSMAAQVGGAGSAG